MSASKRWMVLCLTGIALWIAAGVIPGVLADDPTDPAPTLIGFAAGGTVFFGLVFGYSLWRTRAKPDPELDALLRELSLEERGEWGARLTAASIGSSRRLVQAYLVLGIIVTGLGLSVMWQEGLDVGNTRITIYAMVGIVVVWAAAVPAILGWARRNSQAALAPLGLTQNGAELVGERNGRAVVVSAGCPRITHPSRRRVERPAAHRRRDPRLRRPRLSREPGRTSRPPRRTTASRSSAGATRTPTGCGTYGSPSAWRTGSKRQARTSFCFGWDANETGCGRR